MHLEAVVGEFSGLNAVAADLGEGTAEDRVVVRAVMEVQPGGGHVAEGAFFKGDMVAHGAVNAGGRTTAVLDVVQTWELRDPALDAVGNPVDEHARLNGHVPLLARAQPSGVLKGNALELDVMHRPLQRA